MVVPFDINNMKTSGEVISVIDGLRTEESTGQVTFSSKGDLIYVPGISAIESELVFLSVDSFKEKVILDADYYGEMKISPDGTALIIQKQDTREIYIYDLESLTMTRLTHNGASLGGVWGPGAKEITYDTFNELYTVDASGTDEPVHILRGGVNTGAYGWSPDGNVLMYGTYDSVSGQDIKFHITNEKKEDSVLMPDKGNQMLASFSPDGKYIAYTSDVSGQSGVYVQPSPADGKRWVISSDGGEEPKWSPNDRILYYRNNQDWFQITFSTENEFSVIDRKKLFTGPYLNVPGYSYDITPDGEYFVLLKPVSSAQTSTKLKIIKNWLEVIKVLAPPKI
jgi:Tol biopolymer transport system component